MANTNGNPDKVLTSTGSSCVSARVGFKLAGVQYGYECWCGTSHGDALRLAEANCNTPCAGDATLKCGGFSVMNIYHTGLGGETPHLLSSRSIHEVVSLLHFPYLGLAHQGHRLVVK